MATGSVQIGAHVRTADPLIAAEATGSDCVQVFLSNPQGWKKPPPRDDAEQLRASKLPIYVHAPYLVNLATANPRVRHPSRKILKETCEAAADVGAAAVIVHGGHAEDSIAEGVERWRKAIEQLQTDVPVYLENTAGGDNAMARYFDAIAQLWDAIGDFGIGFCLDTCHTHCSGEELEGAVDRILAITGRIDLVHANDSKDPAGSGRDRHENLGAGQIPTELILETVRAAKAPAVVETPEDGMKDDVAFLRENL